MPRDGQPAKPIPHDATGTTPVSSVDTATSDPTLPPPKASPPKASQAQQPPEFTETDEFIGKKAPPAPPLASIPLGLAPTLAQAPSDPAEAQSAATLKPVSTTGLPPLATSSGPAITTGASFGDYQVIETIAKGGMGIVFKARQRNLNRIVAIKMILAGQFADQTDVDRFYAEATAAAALSHPNIVPIHEIGEAQGQHFFSMEYIEGQSLAALVRENPLTARRAAELVLTIAETMQFAHDRGIVHRDLKPANVLLDGKERPLITDFGLAKQVSNQSQASLSGAIVGTPSYMPPEQAQGQGELVGPVSDIYSLGAILYELVTGRPPFRAASPLETMRQVIEEEPLSPRLVNPSVPRDLETICLKCLQKDRARRYATSQELADELGRFLRGEPINARPISRVARLWRLCKRYPVAASAIAAAVLLLASTAVVATGAYITTSAALTESEQSRRDAMGAVNDLFTRVSEDTLLNQPGMQPLRKDLYQRALSYYQRFLKQRGNDPRVQDELAAALFRVGLITEVLESPDRALESYESARQMQVRLLQARPDNPARLEALGNTLNAIGTVRVKQKKYDAARQEYNEAIGVRTRLGKLQPAASEPQRVLANTLMNLGLAEFNAQNLPAARQQFDAAQKIRQAALASDKDNAKLRRDLGKGFFNIGNLEMLAGRGDEAKKFLTSAVETFEDLTARQPNELDNQKVLAICYRFLGDLAGSADPNEGRRRYNEALGRLEPLAERNPEVIDYQTERAGIYMNLALLEIEAGRGSAAIAALEQARVILDPLAERFPSVPRYQRDLAATLRELAIEQHAAGQTKQAAEHLARALQMLTALARQFPDDPEYAEQLEKTKAVRLESM